jgi:hypothetical protein
MTQCIFCKQEKPEDLFNEEHVFPAAMGGVFIINNVCTECNSHLGKRIDDPFCRHEMVLYYRNTFRIGRGNRTNIPNPVKGRRQYEDGTSYIVQFNEQGQPEPFVFKQLIPPVQASDGWIGTVHLSPKEFTSIEDVKAEYAKKFGIDPSSIKEVKKYETQYEPQKVQVSSENITFILGTLKIAYELATITVPGYLADERGQLLCSVLTDDKAFAQQKYEFNDDQQLRKDLTEALEGIQGIQTWHHGAIITTLKGKGLVCGVRIFNWTYAVLLSPREDYSIPPLIIINDAIERVWTTNWSITVRLASFRITLDAQQLTTGQRKVLESGSVEGHFNSGDKTPVYNSAGELMNAHLGDIQHLSHITQHHFKEGERIEIPYRFKTPAFLKMHSTGELYALQEVVFVYEVKSAGDFF